MVVFTEESKDLNKSKRLDHLSLVAGMFDKLGLGEAVDESLGCLKVMIVNGLDFTTRPYTKVLHIRKNQLQTQHICLKLGPLHRQVLKLMGHTFPKIYLDSS